MKKRRMVWVVCLALLLTAGTASAAGAYPVGEDSRWSSADGIAWTGTDLAELPESREGE